MVSPREERTRDLRAGWLREGLTAGRRRFAGRVLVPELFCKLLTGLNGHRLSQPHLVSQELHVECLVEVVDRLHVVRVLDRVDCDSLP